VRKQNVPMQIRRFLASGIVAVVVLATPWQTAPIVAAQATAAAQDEFVPLDSLPPDEQLPAAPLVLAAYAIAWLIVLVYLWSIWQRLGRVEREMREVSARLKGVPRRDDEFAATSKSRGATGQ
jgi:CcmD family protein